jgi:hypothetical protein
MPVAYQPKGLLSVPVALVPMAEQARVIPEYPRLNLFIWGACRPAVMIQYVRTCYKVFPWLADMASA